MKKDDLRQPDVFIATSNNVLHYVERHAKLIFATLGLIVLVSLAYLGFTTWQSSQEKQAASHIYSAEAPLKQAQSDIEKEKVKKWEELVKSSGGKADPKLADGLRPINFESDYLPKVTALLAAIKDVHESRAALLSSMGVVDFLIENGKWKLAQDAMAIPTYKPDSKELLFGLTEMHRGLVALENGQADEAISHYQSILGNPSQKLLFPEAYLKLGVSFEAKKDFKKAKETYQRVIQDYSTSDAATEAGQFLKLIELKGEA